MTQTSPSVETPRVLGFDVAKDEIVAYDHATRRTFKIPNSKAHLRAALLPHKDYQLAVCETTGGYENTLLDVCLDIGLPIHRAHAKRIKAFIKSYGENAKTDAIDAAWIARFGVERRGALKPYCLPDEAKSEMAELVRLRQDMLNQRTQAKNRRSSPNCGCGAPYLDALITFYSEQIAKLDRAIAKIIKANDEIQRDEDALRATPGIGPVSARALLALLPELGTLSKKQAASLAGLAPHPRDSGKFQGQRRTGLGRHGLKGPLFMASMRAVRDCPVLKDFYERLTKAGKPKRLALTAVARKLVVRANAILKYLRNPTRAPLIEEPGISHSLT